jgi:hypothetical protein
LRERQETEFIEHDKILAAKIVGIVTLTNEKQIWS